MVVRFFNYIFSKRASLSFDLTHFLFWKNTKFTFWRAGCNFGNCYSAYLGQLSKTGNMRAFSGNMFFFVTGCPRPSSGFWFITSEHCNA